MTHLAPITGTRMNPSPSHPLDNPVWNALGAAHAPLRLGDDLACRYLPDVAPFAALASESAQAWQALAQLLQPGEQVAVLGAEPQALDAGLRTQPIGVLHQMTATVTAAACDDACGITLLGSADAADMLELAQATKPGPFCKRTHEMGRYIGIRDQGRLIAMAGERMRPEGHVEISAVCVDPAWRGKGIAGQLIKRLQAGIQQRGDTPFLHVLASNHTAIALYERLGFTLRRTFFLTLVGLAEQNV